MKVQDYAQMIRHMTRDKTTDVPGSIAHGLRNLAIGPRGMVGEITEEQTQFGRPIYQTPAGEKVSEKSVTLFFNGDWMNVPSIHGGKSFNEDELRLMIKQGNLQPTSVHKSKADAEAAAIARSDSMAHGLQTGFYDGGRIGFSEGKNYRVRSDDPNYVPKKGGPSPITVKGTNNPNYKPLNKKEKEIARKQFKDEIKKYGSVEKWAADGKNYLKKSDIRRGRITLDTKRTGVKVGDPDRIRTVAKRGQENISDVIFPDKKMPSGKTMKQEFLDDLDEKFSKPRGQGLQNADFMKKYPVTDRPLQRIINYYIKKRNLKYPKGESTSVGSYKRRKDRYGDVTDLTIEDDISKRIKRPLLVERGMTRDMGKVKDKGVIDFAHRISKEHAKKLGIQFGTETTGFDSRLINQVIVRPSEIRLEKFYERQSNVLDKIKSKGATKELIKEMDEINDLINKEVKKTSGRLMGVNIDPRTQEISFTGQKKKFKLSNLNKTFRELKDIPFEERNEIFRKQIAKGIDAEIKRGFRPFDFKEILGDPKNRQTLLKYAKENAPDIFSKFKNILNNPMSKKRFALYSKLPAAAIPAGIVMALADQSGEAMAADGTQATGFTTGEKAAIGIGAAGTLGTKIGRKALSKLTGLGFGPTGVGALTYAFSPEGGYDLSRTGDRLGFEVEAALAPTLVKGVTGVSSKIKNPLLRKGIETLAGVRIPGLINPANVLRAARIASPIGIASLAGEGIYKLGKLGYEDQKRFDALSPEEQAAERAEQEAFAFDITGA